MSQLTVSSLVPALDDAQVLAAHGRPVLRLHLLDRAAGLVALMHALQEHR
jgi:glucose-6-phosphate isomerase